MVMESRKPISLEDHKRKVIADLRSRFPNGLSIRQFRQIAGIARCDDAEDGGVCDWHTCEGWACFNLDLQDIFRTEFVDVHELKYEEVWPETENKKTLGGGA